MFRSIARRWDRIALELFFKRLMINSGLYDIINNWPWTMYEIRNEFKSFNINLQ